MGLRDCTLIASECEITGHGLLLKEHCFSAHKVVMARHRGYDPGSWVAGYNDSAENDGREQHQYQPAEL